MAERGLLYGDREWFYDVRTPLRRMAISTHETEALVVISLWQGDVCTATFRLPLADAARVVSLLTNGMARAIPAPPDFASHQSEGGQTSVWARVRRVFRARPRDGAEGRLHVVR